MHHWVDETLGSQELEWGRRHSVLPVSAKFLRRQVVGLLSSVTRPYPLTGHWVGGHVSVPHGISTSSLPQAFWGPRLVHSTAGVDEDLHGPVEGVPVGQGDNDTLGRACRRGGVGLDLVGGTLHP